jgi:hypothetical protein
MGRALDQTNPELALKIWNGGSRLSRIASEKLFASAAWAEMINELRSLTIIPFLKI